MITTVENQSKIETIIGGILINAGIKPHHRGYEYLITALELVHKYPYLKYETMHLYTKTAEIHSKTDNKNVNGYSVERAIRYAIQFAYDHKTKTVLSFMDDLDDVHCPTNSEFIAKASCYINWQNNRNFTSNSPQLSP